MVSKRRGAVLREAQRDPVARSSAGFSRNLPEIGKKCKNAGRGTWFARTDRRPDRAGQTAVSRLHAVAAAGIRAAARRSRAPNCLAVRSDSACAPARFHRAAAAPSCEAALRRGSQSRLDAKICCARLPDARLRCAATDRRSAAASLRYASSWCGEMDFAFLLRPPAQVAVHWLRCRSRQRCMRPCYDLLASEARIAAFLRSRKTTSRRRAGS